MGLSFEQIYVGLVTLTAMTLLFSILGLAGSYALTRGHIWTEFASGAAVNAVRAFLVLETVLNLAGLILAALKRFKTAAYVMVATAIAALIAFGIAVGEASDTIKDIYGLGWGCSFEITAFVFALLSAGGCFYADKQG